jgi:hypothetical protein
MSNAMTHTELQRDIDAITRWLDGRAALCEKALAAWDFQPGQWVLAELERDIYNQGCYRNWYPCQYVGRGDDPKWHVVRHYSGKVPQHTWHCRDESEIMPLPKLRRPGVMNRDQIAAEPGRIAYDRETLRLLVADLLGSGDPTDDGSAERRVVEHAATHGSKTAPVTLALHDRAASEITRWARSLEGKQ